MRDRVAKEWSDDVGWPLKIFLVAVIVIVITCVAMKQISYNNWQRECTQRGGTVIQHRVGEEGSFIGKVYTTRDVNEYYCQ